MACFDTKEDKMQNNMRILLDSLASNAVDHRGFYQTDVGDKANKLYGTKFCRGAKNCFDCALNSTRVASSDCSMKYFLS